MHHDLSITSIVPLWPIYWPLTYSCVKGPVHWSCSMLQCICPNNVLHCTQHTYHSYTFKKYWCSCLYPVILVPSTRHSKIGDNLFSCCSIIHRHWNALSRTIWVRRILEGNKQMIIEITGWLKIVKTFCQIILWKWQQFVIEHVQRGDFVTKMFSRNRLQQQTNDSENNENFQPYFFYSTWLQ